MTPIEIRIIIDPTGVRPVAVGPANAIESAKPLRSKRRKFTLDPQKLVALKRKRSFKMQTIAKMAGIGNEAVASAFAGRPVSLKSASGIANAFGVALNEILVVGTAPPA